MNSLPSINPDTIVKIKLAVSQMGTDAEFLATLMESIQKVLKGSGFGKISVYVKEKKVDLVRTEETHSFNNTQEKKVG